ncbi:hypothetical protein BCV72DRAFT_231514 [Rhizopus microsporus var. microsporus]|uniref:Uncharacterized protein n=2 Tax=Rhizopus microsporus TaxID=58291 RepID=A0A2G4SLK6_RHIZD|nr:uncharacterized protein RHIMIDRAFT_261931 [Rhizopus microsporus ATCC 52813]ORE04480.1 hypothetical protein BCV72DRAFT_231514 [Rhizopus microsporus var. microsporus]PHZ09644.1 hypothetical protein RHIMIDRAFT_261931 [Rhizopus microsporus ATCC 52813]
MNIRKFLVLVFFLAVCVALPVKRASTDMGTLCSVVIGGVFADCIINNSCSPTRTCGAVVGGFVCWLAGRAENVLDFKIQSSQSDDTSTCECVKQNGYCYLREDL